MVPLLHLAPGMLRSAKSLQRYRVIARDGDVGSVSDLYFDDNRWTLRYLVVDTGGAWTKHPVLISPIALLEADGSTQIFHLALTRAEVTKSPGIELDEPVSLQHQRDHSLDYEWGEHSGQGESGNQGDLAYMGLPTYAPAGTPKSRSRAARASDETNGDPHLRSIQEITGYHVEGRDGEIGHVADVLVDDETWVIRYLVLDTSNWWFGRKVLVPPHRESQIDWADRKIHVDLTREAIKNSPEWKADEPVSREYERLLEEHYGRDAF